MTKRRRAPPARQRGRARGVPARGRARRDAEGLAARGAQGAGRRRPDVRGREPRHRQGLRPLLGLAQPGYCGVASEAPAPSQAVQRDARRRSSRTRARPAQTFYFSSSGGTDAERARRFGSDVPYLVAVDDPWDEESPNHRWAARSLTRGRSSRSGSGSRTPSRTRRRPGHAGQARRVRLATNDRRQRATCGSATSGRGSGSSRRASASASSGSTRPAECRQGAVALTGVARDVGDAVLEQRGPRGRLGHRQAARAGSGRHLRGQAQARGDHRLPARGGRLWAARRSPSGSLRERCRHASSAAAGRRRGARVLRSGARGALHVGSSGTPTRRPSRRGRAGDREPRGRASRPARSPSTPRAGFAREDSPASARSSALACAASRSRRPTRSRRVSGTRRKPRLRRLGRRCRRSPPVRVAVIDSGVDLGTSRPRSAHRRLEELRRRHGAGHAGPRNDRRGRDRGRARQRHRDRRARAVGRAARREGRRPARHDLRRGGGEGDPLGSRQRRARRQHQPRRASRPAEPRPRHVLPAGGRRRSRTRSRRASSSSRRSGTATRRRTRRGAIASYPAALPHVLGVSALARSGSSPSFSNRDAVYNDVAAPGEDILSTFPRSLTADATGVRSTRATRRARRTTSAPPEGTSFAAPQVTRGRREPARRAAAPATRAGRGDHRAHGGRRERRDRMPRVRARARPAHGLGRTRRGGGGRSLGGRFRRATATSRTTTPGRAYRLYFTGEKAPLR